jgi:hypothetical protein
VLAKSLPEESLRRFLRRTRKESGLLELPALGELLAETLELSTRLLGYRAATLLLDEPTLRLQRLAYALTRVAACGEGVEHLLGSEAPIDEGIVGNVYQTGKTFAGTAAEGAAVIVVPVKLERAVCGVLEVVGTAAGAPRASVTSSSRSSFPDTSRAAF